MVNAINTIASDFPRLTQHITQMDVSVYNAGDDTSNYGNNIPVSVLAEQGWLYKNYFDVFRRLKGKLSAVTFWGMADDDTWLDGFPVARTDYPLPFNMQLQAKPAYWGIVDPTQLPGYGLKFYSTETWTDTRLLSLTLTATNGDVGPAYATQINGFELQQTEGPRCAPAVTAPGSYPILLGDLAVSGSASAAFTVDFTSCSESSRFSLRVPWSSATYETGAYEREIHNP
jgi:endo-1,4-beta-xylanase